MTAELFPDGRGTMLGVAAGVGSMLYVTRRSPSRHRRTRRQSPSRRTKAEEPAKAVVGQYDPAENATRRSPSPQPVGRRRGLTTKAQPAAPDGRRHKVHPQGRRSPRDAGRTPSSRWTCPTYYGGGTKRGGHRQRAGNCGRRAKVKDASAQLEVARGTLTSRRPSSIRRWRPAIFARSVERFQDLAARQGAVAQTVDEEERDYRWPQRRWEGAKVAYARHRRTVRKKRQVWRGAGPMSNCGSR